MFRNQNLIYRRPKTSSRTVHIHTYQKCKKKKYFSVIWILHPRSLFKFYSSLDDDDDDDGIEDKENCDTEDED